MSKPTVKVKDKQYAVSQISVILKLNSGPLIYLRLSEKLDGTDSKISNEETFKQEFFADICSEAEGSFEWGGSLKFFLVGYNSPQARTFELVGLVVKKDLIDWFNQNNFKEKKEDYLIYQKGKGKNSWSFFNMVLGDKFKQPNQDFINKTDLLFPDNGCIWRYKESNNFHFLNRAIAFASRHLPHVQGWCGFDDSKPLRLIIFEEEKQDKTIPKLDNTWAASSYPFVPNRYSWNRWLDKSSTLTRELSIQEGQEMALIKKLTSHGLNDEDGKSYQAQNPTQLLFSPGTITIGEKNIFCHTITYELKLPAFGEESPSVTMKIEVDYPERQIGDNEIVSLRLPGKFKEWHQQKDGETEIKLVASDLKNWGTIDEGNQSLKSGNDAVLSTHILSPTYSDKKYSGIYVKHEKDDEMIVDIHPCSIPLVLGSVQKYRKQLEEADVTLSGQKLAISVSEHHQSLDKSEAIVLNNSEIKLNHGKKIFGQAQQKVDFLSQNVKIGSSKVEINSGKTNINSLVNISFPSPKFATPNVPSSSGIARLASDKVDTANHISNGGKDDKALPEENSKAAPMQVFIKGFDGKSKALDITPDTKISEIKKRLGFESADVYLTNGTKNLDEEKTVADYPNIQKESNIEVRGRLRGGSPLNQEAGIGEASTSNEGTTRIIRQDRDFEKAEYTKSGKPTRKSHIDKDGSLVPANPEGSYTKNNNQKHQVTALEHIYGGDPAKSNSPFTSFLTSKGGVPKTYGDSEIELNLPKLEKEIKEGRLKDVEILTPENISGMIEDDIKGITDTNINIDAALANGSEGIDNYISNLNLSKKKSSKLNRKLLAYHNTTRDGEYLVKGVIPKTYFKGPNTVEKS